MLPPNTSPFCVQRTDLNLHSAALYVSLVIPPEYEFTLLKRFLQFYFLPQHARQGEAAGGGEAADCARFDYHPGRCAHSVNPQRLITPTKRRAPCIHHQ
eukprot:5922654-Pyramimonas_sp.AAC.1